LRTGAVTIAVAVALGMIDSVTCPVAEIELLSTATEVGAVIAYLTSNVTGLPSTCREHCWSKQTPSCISPT
jgi:hypothetical protein